jgi:hypothetical protein
VLACIAGLAATPVLWRHTLGDQWNKQRDVDYKREGLQGKRVEREFFCNFNQHVHIVAWSNFWRVSLEI